MIQCNAFQLDAFQNDCGGEAFQCDAFQLDAFQNDCADLPVVPGEPARRRQRIVVLLPPGERVRVTTPLEEWKREREREPSMHDLALQEDEELLFGLWD